MGCMNTGHFVMKYGWILFLCGILGMMRVWGQPPSSSRPLLITHAKVHVGDGRVLADISIVIDQGVITQMVPTENFRIEMSRYRILDVDGQHVYPGFILPNTRLGLEEISAVRASRDYREVGEFNAHIRSLVAYNATSELIPTLRHNGILLAQVVPEGGFISGQSSIMALSGKTWEDAVYHTDDGIHMRWPRKGFSEEKKKRYEEEVEKIRAFVAEAGAYIYRETWAEKNLKLEAMRALFEGKKKLFLHAYRHDEILDGLHLAFLYGWHDVVLVGAWDAEYVLDFLRQNNISVLLDDVHRLPSRAQEDIDGPYRLPAILHKAGILVGLCYRAEVQSARNLPFFAGTAAAYGLSKEEALQLITLNTAKILGIAQKTGTVEVGKDANIVISKGDVLDMQTSQITHAFIRGKQVDIHGRQEQLYEYYMKKYKAEGKLWPPKASTVDSGTPKSRRKPPR